MYDKKIANNLRKMDENESATFFVNDDVLLYWSFYNSSNVFATRLLNLQMHNDPNRSKK